MVGLADNNLVKWSASEGMLECQVPVPRSLRLQRSIRTISAPGRPDRIRESVTRRPPPGSSSVSRKESRVAIMFGCPLASASMSVHSATMQNVCSPVLIMLACTRPDQPASILLWASRNSCSRLGFTRKRTTLNAVMVFPFTNGHGGCVINALSWVCPWQCQDRTPDPFSKPSVPQRHLNPTTLSVGAPAIAGSFNRPCPPSKAHRQSRIRVN